jgi:hypothetical protein
MGYARQYDNPDRDQGGQRSGRDAVAADVCAGRKQPAVYAVRRARSHGRAVAGPFAVLGTSPLFLSDAGVCAVAGTAVSQQRSVQKPSQLINGS